ncbi:MAG TPA: TIGR00725 family protein [Longimicrobiales bacterium]|nr:TIGR00725 family protein [Longimicrobiales bacterium]
MIAQRPVRIAVCGSGTPNQEIDRLAEQVGLLLARKKAVLLCGGLFGAMEAAARGALSAGGLTVGFLPGVSPDDANDHIVLPIATGLGEARNTVLVRSADAVIAIGGEWGTLSEIALAKKIGRPVILLNSAIAAHFDLPTAQTAEQAVQMALAAAQAS